MMNFLRDRQFRNYFIFLIAVLSAVSVSFAAIWWGYGQMWKKFYIEHHSAVASSLLEQGVSRGVIARAFTAEEEMQEGKNLLGMMGIGEETSVFFLPGISGIQDKMAGWMAGLGVCLWLFLVAGTGLFFYTREKVYARAAETVKKFIEGDFSESLFFLEEGGLGRLFGKADNLAKALAAQNEAAGKAREFLKDMISDISHQLKTPLAALTMYNEIILSEPDNQDTVVKFTEKASGALLRMEQLILTLLKVTRLDAGAVMFERQSYPAADVVSRGIGELIVRAKQEEKEIILSGPEDMMLNCDLQWTGEALGNLVKNALDYTEPGGKIEVSWKEVPGMARISVADNGRGIREEDFYHLFKRFYRAGKGEGIGLGLPLAKAVMDGQGGTLSACNIPGGGAVFVMTFLD